MGSLATREPWTYGRWALRVHNKTITRGGYSRVSLREAKNPPGDIRHEQKIGSRRNSLTKVPGTSTSPSQEALLGAIRSIMEA
jgi:hypothetical protein